MADTTDTLPPLPEPRWPEDGPCSPTADAYSATQMHAYALYVIAERDAEIERLKADHLHACETIARMHAAAVGSITGPKRGVVEDVADLRAEVAALQALLDRVITEGGRTITSELRADVDAARAAGETKNG